MKLHGKRHKSDSYYFRWHYGKQRRVCITKEYVDKPTEKQVSAREACTALRREVARQLRDADLRAAWMRRFEADNEGYKMLHTYVYAKLKRGETVVTKATGTTGATKATMSSMRRGNALISTTYAGSELPILVLWNGVIVPIFLRNTVPIEQDCSG